MLTGESALALFPNFSKIMAKDISKNPLEMLEGLWQQIQKEQSDKPSPYWQTPSFDALGDRYNKLNGNQYGDLVELLIGSNKPMSGSAMEDWNKQILDAILQKYFQNDQRAYDRQVLEEQREYDNPLNALSRLTGAGIGRDAAIQMLSGAGSGAGIGAGSGAAVTAPQGIPASQSTLNGVQSALAPINTLFSAASTIGSLVSLGVSLPGAVAQNNILQNQSRLTQDTVNSMQAVNSLGSAFAGLVSDRTLNPDDFKNADEALNYAIEHQDSNAFKPLFQDGSFSRVYGTPSGRELWSKYWNSTLSSRHSGDMLDSQLRLSRLSELLGEISTATAQRDFYIGFVQAYQDMLKNDKELEIYDQQLRNGEIQISINGQILEQEKLNTAGQRRANEEAEIQHEAYMDVMQNGMPATPDINSNGKSILRYNMWTNFYQTMCRDLSIADSNTIYSYNYNKPDLSKGSTNAERTMQFYRDNRDVAITGLVVQKAINEGRLEGWTGDHKSMYQFFDMFNASGAGQTVQAGATGVGALGTMLKIMPK